MNSNNQLITGERARLIPVKKEEKATASLLATFRVTPELAKLCGLMQVQMLGQERKTIAIAK